MQLIDVPLNATPTRQAHKWQLLAIVATLDEGERQTRCYGELFQVTVADTLTAGMALTHHWVPDVITLDTDFYVDGKAQPMLATLRADPRMRHTALCVISDDDRIPTKITALLGGADHYIMRNLAPHLQLDGIRRILILVRRDDYPPTWREPPHE